MAVIHQAPVMAILFPLLTTFQQAPSTVCDQPLSSLTSIDSEPSEHPYDRLSRLSDSSSFDPTYASLSITDQQQLQQLQRPQRNRYDHLTQESQSAPILPPSYTSIETINMQKQIQQQHKLDAQRLLREKQAKEQELAHLLGEQTEPPPRPPPPRPPRHDLPPNHTTAGTEYVQSLGRYDVIDASQEERQQLYLERLNQEARMSDDHRSSGGYADPVTLAGHDYLPPNPREGPPNPREGPPLPPRNAAQPPVPPRAGKVCAMTFYLLMSQEHPLPSRPPGYMQPVPLRQNDEDRRKYTLFSSSRRESMTSTSSSVYPLAQPDTGLYAEQQVRMRGVLWGVTCL
jgi:hypothetical protein